jgi:hypothetical protein
MKTLNYAPSKLYWPPGGEKYLQEIPDMAACALRKAIHKTAISSPKGVHLKPLAPGTAFSTKRQNDFLRLRTNNPHFDKIRHGKSF